MTSSQVRRLALVAGLNLVAGVFQAAVLGVGAVAGALDLINRALGHEFGLERDAYYRDFARKDSPRANPGVN